LIWAYRKLGNLSNQQIHQIWRLQEWLYTQHTVILSSFLCKWNCQKMGCFVVKRYAVRMAKTWRYAVHKAEIGRHAVRQGMSPLWKWSVVHVLSLSGLGFQIKYSVTNVRKTTTFCLKHSFCKNKTPSPFTQTWVWLALSFHVNVSFMLKDDRGKCEWKPTIKYSTKYCVFVSFLHIHTKYLDLQACKKLAHSGVKAFDNYMCTSVNVKKCTSYIVNENYKICYTVQYIQVQDLYMFTMLCTFYVFTS